MRALLRHELLYVEQRAITEQILISLYHRYFVLIVGRPNYPQNSPQRSPPL